MRVCGRRALAGQGPAGAERAYDGLYPLYDPELEGQPAQERPAEYGETGWRLGTEEEESWRAGKGGDDWGSYPDRIGGMSLIGERTFFGWPEWGHPRERRWRGVAWRVQDLKESALGTAVALTYKMYLRGEGQIGKPLVVWNDERQLAGPCYRWAAINASVALSLGWRPATDTPFRWLDSTGKVMVESVYWRDGWTGIAAPLFGSVGEGWVVRASDRGLEAIRSLAGGAELHLWVERRSEGERACEWKWHLSRTL